MSEVISFKNNKSLLVDFLSFFKKNFLDVNHFRICYNIASGFFNFGGDGDKACGILAP